MKLHRTIAVARKEALHVLRDPRSMAMAIAIPMLMLILFGYALTLDVDRVPILIWNQSDSPQSREFLSRFTMSRYFALQGYVDGYSTIERAIDTRRALLALVVPPDFARLIATGRPAPVQLIVDGSDSNTAIIATSYAEAVAQSYSLEVTQHIVRRAGGRPQELPIDLRPRVWFNSDLESRNYIIPGLIAVIMMIIAALITSLTIAREWETGTMEQLIATPITGAELICGKLVPYFVLGMIDVTLAILMGEFLFDVPLRGSIALLFVVSAVFLMGVLSLGALISIIAKNQLMASQLAMILTYLPAFLLSGFMYSLNNTPKAIQVVSYVVPARYFVTVIKGIYLKGTGLQALWTEILFLAVFGAGMLILANRKFKKSLA